MRDRKRIDIDSVWPDLSSEFVDGLDQFQNNWNKVYVVMFFSYFPFLTCFYFVSYPINYLTRGVCVGGLDPIV